MKNFILLLLCALVSLMSQFAWGNENNGEAPIAGGCTPNIEKNERRGTKYKKTFRYQGLGGMEKELDLNNCQELDGARRLVANDFIKKLETRDAALIECVDEEFSNNSQIIGIEIQIFWDEEWGDLKNLAIKERRGDKLVLKSSVSSIHKCILSVLLAEETWGTLRFNHRISCETNNIKLPYALNK
jgi:hypothetical protein